MRDASHLLPVGLEGPEALLDTALLRLAHLMTFPPHPHTAGEENPYDKLLERIRRIADNAMIPLSEQNIAAFTAGEEEIRSFVGDFSERFGALQSGVLEADEALAQDRNLLEHLRRLGGMNIRLEDIFACKYIRVRFGRLPRDSEAKMDYFGGHLFLFFPFSASGSYVWGVCFTTNEFAAETDNILDALFFERVRIPGDIRGTPAEAEAELRGRFRADAARRDRLGEEFGRLVGENSARFVRFYNEARHLRRLYETRRCAGVYAGRFYLTGFVAKDALRRLEKEAAGLAEVRLEVLPRG